MLKIDLERMGKNKYNYNAFKIVKLSFQNLLTNY